MKKALLIIACAIITSSVYAQSDPNLGIIPVPVSINQNAGSFTLDKTVVLIAKNADEIKMANLFNTFIKSKVGYALNVSKTLQAKQKAIILTNVGADKLPNEGYTLKVNPSQVELVGKDAGLFYAMQTAIQIFTEKSGDKIVVPSVEINDYPRFKYRGAMLDVARHFFPLEFVKKYIDYLSQYKINNFHWHLTEDQGWRIEIKKYPKLTQVGSTRNGTIIGRYPGIGNTLTEYKGFYTQEEAKEIVRYAAERYVNVIPEIEMPGHASAAIAAYPELSSFPDSSTYISEKTAWAGSRTGKNVQQTFGVFDDIFVPSDNTFNFLQDVLDEVIAIFPSKFIHIGGDEAPKKYWAKSPFCQALIKEKDLKDEHGLQSYFIHRIEKYLNAKGRNIIGWDEILEGGLAPNATVMSWRGEKGGIEAAKQHHNVIMTPGSGGLYIDHRQSTSPDEPVLIGGLAPFTKTYMYDPIPKELTAEESKYVLGVQANLWTEYITSPAKAEYQAFPRILTLSEVAWSPLARKDLKSFAEERLPKHLNKLDKDGVNFWVPTAMGVPEKPASAESFSFDFKVPVNGGKIYYSIDGSRPSENATLYTKPFTVLVPKGENRTLKTIVVTPSGRRSVTTETILDNGAPTKAPVAKAK
jgi:hexosaminidase